jgi:hypothetical protein
VVLARVRRLSRQPSETLASEGGARKTAPRVGHCEARARPSLERCARKTEAAMASMQYNFKKITTVR